MYKFIAFLILIPSLAFAWSTERFEVGASFVPPHNEPVIEDEVARYKIEMDGSVRFWKRVTADLNVIAWGVQTWRTGDQVGHGFPDAWRGSDWGVKKVYMDYTGKVGVDVYGPVQAFVEHRVRPYHLSSNNYWLFGFRYRWR
jgi:hypothetical protein